MADIGFVFRRSWVRDRPALRLLKELKRSEGWSPAELEAFQNRELRRLVRHAYRNVPHYWALFRELGLGPGAIRGLGDLERLPVLSRDTARSSAEERQSLVWAPTSERWQRAIRLRAQGWAGHRPGGSSLRGPRSFETYETRELGLVASECDAHEGLHVMMENVIVETLVREGSHFRPAEPGEIGELAVTDLHDYGMPKLRYSSGDRAMATGRERCRCGRWHQRLALVDSAYSSASTPKALSLRHSVVRLIPRIRAASS